MQKINNQNQQTLLNQRLEEFVSFHNITPYFGVELEFYILNSDFSQISDKNLVKKYINLLKQNLSDCALLQEIEEERGIGQIEVKTKKSANLQDIGKNLQEIKSAAQNLAEEMNLKISFEAQPFLDDCGSALQFNFSLFLADKNLFAKDIKLMENSIAGLIFKLPEILSLIVTKQDLIRFDREVNLNLHKKGKFTAPVNISFGYNNRSTAIRIPDTRNFDEKRVEFRVAPANSDPYLNMNLILEAVDFALKNDLLKNGFDLEKYRVFGNAFDEKYQLVSLI